jgi:hypothetical protein
VLIATTGCTSKPASSWHAPTAVLKPADMVERLTVWIKRRVEVHLPLSDAELVAHWPPVKAGFRQRSVSGPQSLGLAASTPPLSRQPRTIWSLRLRSCWRLAVLRQGQSCRSSRRSSLPSHRAPLSRQPGRHKQPGYMAERRLVPCCRACKSHCATQPGGATVAGWLPHLRAMAMDRRAMAHVLMTHFAALSVAAATSPVAQDAVLQAVAP